MKKHNKIITAVAALTALVISSTPLKNNSRPNISLNNSSINDKSTRIKWKSSNGKTVVFNRNTTDYKDGELAYASGDYELALTHWLKVAEEGSHRAQYNLGWMYANGKGTSQNFPQAVYWYTKSAEQGNVYAQYNLGNLYLRGHGVTQNDELAFKWFTKAAEQGDAPSQYNLGRMCLKLEQLVMAKKWLTLALKNNDKYISALAQQVWDEYKLGSN
jgi:uncharacterized protein